MREIGARRAETRSSRIVAGILVQGRAYAFANRFLGKGPGQGSAVWVWDGSTTMVADSFFDGYRNAVNASGSKVTATDNTIRNFEGPPIIVRKPSSPARVYGNTAVSEKAQEKPVSVEGDAENSGGNVIKKPEEVQQATADAVATWPMPEQRADGNSYRADANSGGQAIVQDGPWKLVATYGETISYKLFNTDDDPQEKTDLSARLENITFRMRGLLERQEAVEFQAWMRGTAPGPRQADVK